MKLIEVEVDVITFWVVPTAMTLMCFWNFSITLWSSMLVVLLCLVTSFICYTKIPFTLHSSSSSSVKRQVSTAGPNKSIKNGAIQKSSVQCQMIASDTGGLLFAPRCSGPLCLLIGNYLHLFFSLNNRKSF